MDTQISLPADLKAKLEREADARGMALPEFVRSSLEWAISKRPNDDPLFSDTAVYRDDGAEDFSSDHDTYLYGDTS